MVMPHVIEAARQSVEAQACHSLTLLTRLLERAQTLPLLLPAVHTFARYTEASPEPEHDWDGADTVSPEELTCQLNFELGRFHFFKGERALSLRQGDIRCDTIRLGGCCAGS